MNFDIPKDNISIGIGRWRTIQEENDSFEIMQKENRYFNCTFFDEIIELNNIKIDTYCNYEYNEYIKKLIKKSPYFEGEKVYFDQYVITKIYMINYYNIKQNSKKQIKKLKKKSKDIKITLLNVKNINYTMNKIYQIYVNNIIIYITKVMKVIFLISIPLKNMSFTKKN